MFKKYRLVKGLFPKKKSLLPYFKYEIALTGENAFKTAYFEILKFLMIKTSHFGKFSQKLFLIG